MTRRELDCIGQMFEALTTVSEPRTAYLQILDASIKLTDAFGGHFAFCKETLQQGRLVDLPSGDPSAMKKIVDDHPHYIFVNPVWPYLAACKGNVLRHLDVVGTHAWENCEFFSGFVRPNRLKDGLCVLFRDADGAAIWALGLMYDQKMNFSKSTIRTLEYMAPYLSRGMHNLEEWNRRWKDFGGIENAHNARQPVVAVKNGKLMFAYGGAEKILNLEGADFRREAHVQELLRLCPYASQTGAQVHWKSRTGEVYKLCSIASTKESLQLIHLAAIHTAQPSADDDERMALAKGLTAREAQVFKRMALGLSYSEIARDLGLSIHTVRTHIRHIYNRLNVTGYVEAINAVRSSV